MNIWPPDSPGAGSVSPMSCIAQMFAWLSADADSASCANRFLASSSVLRWGGRNFRATVLFEARVLGEIYYAHSAAAQLLKNLEVRYGLADHEASYF